MNLSSARPGLLLLLIGIAKATFTAITSQDAEYLDVGSSSWSVVNANGSIHIPAMVPGYIHLDLYDEGVIPDPTYGNNFNFTTWIAADNWTYTCQLPAMSPKGKVWSSFEKVYILFEGLDTVANISVNSQSVGFANNQFRQWIFDVTDAIGCQNGSRNVTLEVAFESPVTYMLDVFESTGSPYTVFTNDFWTYPEGREYIRKDQSSFGWDWGPHFAPTGIYRSAYLIGLDSGAYVTNTFVDIYKDGQHPNVIANQSAPWVVNVSVDYLAAMEGLQPAMTVSVAGQTVSVNNVTATVAGPNTAELLFNVTEGSVERWWPAEFGTPHLYNMMIELDMGGDDMSAKNNSSSNSSSNALTYVKRVGFRTVVLNLTPYTDRFGSNFHFEVNGQPFNTKGSNMVPTDPFESRVDYSWYKRLMQSAIASNFNMIRLWASGNYYSDDLYDIADELGIFLWSEFQFSDNYYPVFPEFLDNVRAEALFQIRRLNRHPCLSVWTGGNELESYNVGKLAYNDTYGQSWFQNFTILSENTIWPLLWSNTRSLSWIQASDSHGYVFYNPDTGAWINRWGADLNGAYAEPYWGPGETYNLVIDQVFNHSTLLASRFMVEFGIWSYDSLESYQTVLPDNEIYQSAPIIVQRCFDTPNPPQQLGDAINSYYILPNRTDNLTQFSQWTYTSQIFHAEDMKSQIESYRRSISLPENNLGQLFWQLNAPWTTLSLNSIEYTGRWKVLQHVASQVFERVAVSSWLEPSNTTWNMWVTSDLWEPVTGIVTATWMTWSGEQLATKVYNFSLDALDSTQLDRQQGWGAILPPGGNTADDVLILKLNASTKSGEAYTNENFFVPKYISNSTIVNPGLKLEKMGDTVWTVTATLGVAAYVWITAPIGVNGYFDRNALFMVKGESRNFNFTVLEDTTNGNWTDSVKVVSLWDNYEIPA